MHAYVEKCLRGQKTNETAIQLSSSRIPFAVVQAKLSDHDVTVVLAAGPHIP